VEFFENLGIPDGSSTPRWSSPLRLSAAGRTIHIQAGPNGSIQGPCEAKWGYTTFTVADWDQDGQSDIILNSIWGEILWYRNEGLFPADGSRRRLPRLSSARPITVQWKNGPPKPQWTWWQPEGRQLVTQWRTTPVAVDWTGDGLNDLVMLDHEGYLALFKREKTGAGLVVHPGQRLFVDENGLPHRLNARQAGGSGRRKLHAVDWDLDGDLDLLLNSVNADFFENIGTRDGQYVFKNRGAIGQRKISGHTSSPASCSFSGERKRSLLVGAEDGLFYLLRRSQLPAGQRTGRP